MRDMAMIESAMPLVNNDGDISGSSVNQAKGFQVTYGWGSQAGTETWESRSLFGCVCDSSWEVRGDDSTNRAAMIIRILFKTLKESLQEGALRDRCIKML